MQENNHSQVKVIIGAIAVIVVALILIVPWLQKKNEQAISTSTGDTMMTASTSEKMMLASPSASPITKVTEPKKIMTKDNGLVIEDIVVGTGAEAKVGSTIAAHYTGTFEGGKKFDSSYDRGTPLEFALGTGQVIKGWDEGIVGMKVGGKRKLVIPGSLAYGPNGIPGAIPPNATLYFDVELVAVK